MAQLTSAVALSGWREVVPPGVAHAVGGALGRQHHDSARRAVIGIRRRRQMLTTGASETNAQCCRHRQLSEETRFSNSGKVRVAGILVCGGVSSVGGWQSNPNAATGRSPFQSSRVKRFGSLVPSGSSRTSRSTAASSVPARTLPSGPRMRRFWGEALSTRRPRPALRASPDCAAWAGIHARRSPGSEMVTSPLEATVELAGDQLTASLRTRSAGNARAGCVALMQRVNGYTPGRCAGRAGERASVKCTRTPRWQFRSNRRHSTQSAHPLPATRCARAPGAREVPAVGRRIVSRRWIRQSERVASTSKVADPQTLPVWN